MAVNPIEPIPKSQPDNSKLNTFTGHTVTVTKHTAPRNSVGQMVVATQPMKLAAILELMTSIPMTYGPGFYRFTVSDTGGTGDDVWMVKLGPDIQEVSSMGNVTPIGPGQPPIGEGVIHLGHGFYYNADLGTLTTPWRTVHNWKQGDQIPTQPTSASAVPTATPWWQGLPQMQNPAMPFGGGWGGYPAVSDSSDTKIRELEARLADQQRQRDADATREEIRRISEEAQKRSDEQSRRFEALVEKLTAKPSGPTESEQRLERELAEQRRRSEDRERDDRLRAEMKAVQDHTDRLIREQNANKQDPMLPLLMTVLTSTQTQAQESVKAIQASTQAAAAASERSTQELVRQLSTSTMTPMQLVQLMQSAKGDGAEMGRMMIDATKETMGMQKAVYEQLLEVAGQSGQPAWVALVQEAMSKVGTIGQAIAERSAAPPAPQRTVAPVQQQRVAAPAQPRTLPPQPARPLTAAEMRDQAASQVGHFTPVPTEIVHAAPMNGAPAQAPVQQATVVASAASPAASSRRKPQKPRRNGRRAPARSRAVAPPADPKGHSIEEIRELPIEMVRESAAQYADERFFDTLLPYVVQLRVSNLPPIEVAKYVMQARATAVQQGLISPAMELLLAEQLEVLVERLFPDAVAEYRAGVIQALADVIGAESVDDDDDEEEEEGDDEGDDAQA